MLKAYKYRIYPNTAQQEQMKHIFGSVRFVYNLGLETKIQAYTAAKKNLTCFDLNNQITDLKKDLDWLRNCPGQALQMSMRNLDNAYTKFFKGAGFPKFKNKYAKQSFSLPQNVRIDLERCKIHLPKLKEVDIIIDRQFEGVIKTVTVYKTVTDKYFVSVLVDNQQELPKKVNIDEDTTVGIDFGIKDLAILSDGTKYDNPKWYQRAQQRLKVEQRTLSRRYKNNEKEQSKSYLKQKLIVAKLHEKIKNQRTDYIHKMTTAITKQYDTIILEDLNVSGMVQNHCLAKAIQNVAWSETRRQFEYKTEWQGKNLLFIGRFDPSSKTCSCCGTINKNLKLSDREWTCLRCNTTHDRDKNAATNIKHFGLRNKITGFRVEPSSAKVIH